MAKDEWQFDKENTSENLEEYVNEIEIASSANTNSLSQFICIFLYLFAPARSNTLA